MSINSAGFLLFLLIAVTVYYAVPKQVRWWVLLAASGAFYLSHSRQAACFLLLTILFTYAAGRALAAAHRMERAELEGTSADRAGVRQRWKHRRRLLLGAALAVNFSSLVLFKYLNDWLRSAGILAGALGIQVRFRPLELLMPLGISFYIFQVSGYLIDVYRGKPAEQNLFRYALFVSWFPQMIQGPINRYNQLQPQLLAGAGFDADRIKYGIQLMLWGMLKKVFLADPLAGAVENVYSGYTQYSGAVLFLGAALYCLQLYCDFSGGTDLVRGVSSLFGVELAENFRRPYFARSMDEFWRRWHISLGEWMKDYLFYPVALSKPVSRLGKRVKRAFGNHLGKLIGPCLSTVIVFLAVGVWQGPGLHNVAYGLWNGGWMSLSMLCMPLFVKAKKRLSIQSDAKWFHCFQVLRTLLLVVIGRYFSRASSLRQALGMLWRTVRHWGGIHLQTFTCFGLTGAGWLGIGLAGAVLLTVSTLQERGIPIRKTLERQRWWVQFAVLFAAVLLLVVRVYLNTDYTAIMYVYENI